MSNSQLSQTPSNGTNVLDDENNAHNEMDESLDHLKLLSKNCHLAEMQCAQCSNVEECKTGFSQPNRDETEFGKDYGPGMNLKRKQCLTRLTLFFINDYDKSISL